MSVRKEKKIRRIRKMRIWPTVIRQIVFTVLFVVVLTAVLELYVHSIEQTNSVSAYKDACQAYSSFMENYVPDSDNSALYSTVKSAIPSVNGIVAADASGAVIEKFGFAEPVSAGDLIEIEFDFVSGTDSSLMCRRYFDSQANPDIEISEDGELSFMLSSQELTVRALETGIMSLFGNDPAELFINDVRAYDLWYVFDRADGAGTVSINADVLFRLSDFLYLFIGIAIIALIFVAVSVYHIITVVQLLLEKDRFYDAIYTDPVTGAKNWEYFTKQAQRTIKRRAGKKDRLAVVHVRTEKYRSFCTCFGVKEGEELAEQLLGEIRKHLDWRESAARHERADFGLLLRYSDEKALERRLEALLDKLGSVRENQKFFFNCGICAVSGKNDSAEALYSNACTARDTVDDDSERRIAWFSDEHQKRRLWEHKVENEAERAFENHEFELYLQPKYSASGEKLAEAEALVRWNHPTEGMIPPGKFIPIFEANGLIMRLDDYMLHELASVQAKWIADGRKPVPVSVNVSRAHFMRTDLSEHIRAIVDEYAVPHEFIELELTESAFFDDRAQLISTVRRLRDYGFRVSMDDFGTGFSSLNSLKELPLDVVKLDAEFFRGGDSERGMLIIGKTIGLAKDLGMKIVAEGIETREQVDFLAENSCDLIQGYYFAKPMPVSEFEKVAFMEQ